MDEDTLVDLFDSNTLPIGLWDHYGRLRVVWTALYKKGLEDSLDQQGWLCTRWKAYKESIGHGEKWHYTLTRFWVHIIHNLNNSSEDFPSFEAFWVKHGESIKQGSYFRNFYSDAVMMDPKARTEWTPPDLKPLPSSSS